MRCTTVLVGAMAVLVLASLAAPSSSQSLTPIEQLGKALFFDSNLSTPPGQSCAACHAPETGFTGPNSAINAAGAAYPGAVHTRTGNRKPPTAAYGGGSPVLYFDETDGLWIGGMFWDGRATGWTLGDPLAEQAQGPFLNTLEQKNPNAKHVCLKVAKSSYAALYRQVWESNPGDPVKDVSTMYENIARSIAAYERSSEVNPFTSKYDLYLEDPLKDPPTLSAQEAEGLALFEGKAMCSACHLSEPGPNGEPPLFTDFTYDNLGVPKNPQNPFYSMPPKWNRDAAAWVDPGLGGFLKGAGYPAAVYEPEWGKHKVPTLRNVDQRPYPEFVKAYGHNGYFKSLEEIVHFYNTRDVEPWPEPEVAQTVNSDELGDLGLTPEEEGAIVAFMETLTDGYIPTPKPVAASGRATGTTRLAQNWPNPFNPTTTIAYDLPQAGQVTLSVYSVSGQRVRTLVAGQQRAGHYELTWDASECASGVYLCRLQLGNLVETRRMLLMR